MLQVGVHCSNRQQRRPQLNAQDLDMLALVNGGVTAIKVMSYHDLDTWNTIDSILHPTMWVVRLIALGDSVNIEKVYARYSDRNVVFELFNEPNNMVEGFGSIDEFAAAYLGAEWRLRDMCPRWKICFPGLSPNSSALTWWRNASLRPLIESADYLGVHSYYTDPRLLTDEREGASWRIPHRLFPDKRLLLTEFCCTAGESGTPRPKFMLAQDYVNYAEWLNAQEGLPVKALCYYLLGSDDERWVRFGETFDNDIARALGALRLKEQIATEVTMPENQTLQEQYREVFNQWVAAGGIESNFADHLMAIGVLPPSLDGLVGLAKQMSSKASQVLNVAQQLAAQSPKG